MISTRQLGIAISLLVLCVSSAAALSLDDALAYSVNGKVCTDSEAIKQVKEVINQVKNAYQTRAVVQAEIEVLKEVRDLINKARESIIKVDSGAVSFLQTAALTPLKDSSYEGVMKLVEVMAQTSDPVDKIALCQQIVTAIDEIVGINEKLLAREDYDSIPTKLTSIIDSIDAFLVNCAKPVEESDGSIKIGTVDNDGKVIIDGGITPEPDTKTNDGSATVGGDGSVTVNTPTTPTEPDTTTKDGSATVGGDGSVQVTTPTTPTEPDTTTKDGSATVGGDGSVQVTDQTAQNQNDGSIKIVDASSKATFLQTGEDTSFVGTKLHHSEKAKKQRKQHSMGF